MTQRNWLDALTDGQILRDWFSLFAHFWIGLAYLIFLSAGFGTAIGLIPVLIGIPLLLFMLASTRSLAALDRRLFGAILDVETAEFAEDVDTEGANLGQRLGLYLGSGATWSSLVYLLLKFPIGMFTLTASMFILPFLALEVLILGPLTIDMRLITVRMLHWVAIGAHKFPGILIPTGKRKRRRSTSHLETPEAAEPSYYIDEEGEIALRKRM